MCAVTSLITTNLLSDFTKFLGADTIDRLSRCEHHIEVALPWRNIKIGKTFYESIRDCRPSAAAEQFSGPVLCIAGESDFSAENARYIAEISHSQNKNAIIIPGADHIFNIGADRSEISSVVVKITEWMSLSV